MSCIIYGVNVCVHAWSKVGEGTYSFSDGTTVDAVFKDSRPNGFGIAKFADGISCFPLPLHSAPIICSAHAWLQIQHKGDTHAHAGTVYEGDFKNGHFHGHGK